MRLDELRTNWDAWGRLDPFWAILTFDDKRGRRWREAEFFGTGRALVDQLLGELRAAGGQLPGGRALDFGCGVGRLTQALAESFERCDGVDIAPSMIELARRYNRQGARCVYHVNDADDLSLFEDGAFDFVLSIIVLQHMRPQHSLRYIREFVRLLATGGLAVFQIPARRRSLPRKSVCEAPLKEGAFRAGILPLRPRILAEPAARIWVAVEVENRGAEKWPATSNSDAAYAVHLGNHWRRVDGSLAVRDDGRATLVEDLSPGEKARLELAATAPAEPGRYWLEFDMVQEAVCWFQDRGSTVARVPAEVRELSLGERLRKRLIGPFLTARHASPAMEMYGVEPGEVERSVAEAGGRVLARREDELAGPEWVSFRYVARRTDPAPGSPARA